MLPLRFSQFLCDHFFSDDLILLPVPTFPFLLPLHAGRRRGVMVGGTTGPLKGITHILTLLFCFFLYTLCWTVCMTTLAAITVSFAMCWRQLRKPIIAVQTFQYALTPYLSCFATVRFGCFGWGGIAC